MTSPRLRLNCPHCKKSVFWDDEHAFKPFCSERCKLIDLGAWADEQYAIPAQTPLDDLLDDDFAALKNQ